MSDEAVKGLQTRAIQRSFGLTVAVNAYVTDVRRMVVKVTDVILDLEKMVAARDPPTWRQVEEMAVELREALAQVSEEET